MGDGCQRPASAALRLLLRASGCPVSVVSLWGWRAARSRRGRQDGDGRTGRTGWGGDSELALGGCPAGWRHGAWNCPCRARWAGRRRLHLPAPGSAWFDPDRFQRVCPCRDARYVFDRRSEGRAAAMARTGHIPL